MKVLFLIRSLENGGAERQLALLANELGRRGHNVAVAVFYSGGVHDSSLARESVRLIRLDKSAGLGAVGFVARLLRMVRDEQPDVIHGYLSAGNLAATLARTATPSAKLAWGIRDSNMEFSNYGRTTQLAYGMACRASRFADVMIFNSQAGFDYWREQGLAAGTSVVIPNGIDVEKFAPDAAAGRAMRQTWGISREVPLIGMAARFDPMKDHPTFLKAAALIAARSEARFVCVGDGAPTYKARMEAMAAELGIAGRVLWPGATTQMRAAFNAMDVFCLPSSYGEGFPNVVAEAMACGRQCVVTDVGDARFVAGNVGSVVPPGDPQALAQAILEAMGDGAVSAETIRARVVRNFTVKVLADRTEEALGLSGLGRSPRENKAAYAS